MEQRKEDRGQLVVFLPSETIGQGDTELGATLMMNFLHHLAISETKPNVLIMMNDGVKLVAEGSELLESLKELEENGTEILACGTCLDFFNLRDRQKLGKASNMKDITRILLTAGKVLTV